MPWRICGKVIAGVHVFPPFGFSYQKPRGQERQRLMLLPTRPVTHLIVRQPGCACAALNTLFNAMLGFGHSSTFPHWGLRRRVREGIIHLHHLLLVAVTGADDPDPDTQGARCPAHAGPCATGPPARSAHPRWPVDAETTTVAPSRRHRSSSHAATRHHCWPTSPRPTGDACERPGRRGEHRLGPGGLWLWAMLWAEQAAGPPGCGPCWRRSPHTGPLGHCRLCPDAHTTVWPHRPTDGRTEEIQKGRTPAPHRLVPKAS